MLLTLSPLALYIHWPFCKFKCPYCDFNSHVREKITHEDWADAYVREMEYYRDRLGPRAVASVFFGGGTPSLMEPHVTEKVVNTIDRLWGLPTGTEVTLEANPTSVEAGKLKGFRAAGVNRVSLGVQALDNDALKKLGRQHSADEAMAAVEMAGGIFDRYTFDLIYARPDQSVYDWEKELAKAIAYGASHMSLYQLTIEPGTQYHTLHARGELKIPDEDTAAEMYELTQQMMQDAGMPAYEISNHAKPGQESRHNLVYWRYGDYAGIGPGAHGRITVDSVKYATRAHRAPEIWMDLVRQKNHGIQGEETVDFAERARELVMMGLRLTEGISLAHFEQESGMPLSSFVNRDRLKALEEEGMITLSPAALTATLKGRQRLNAVLSYLLS